MADQVDQDSPLITIFNGRSRDLGGEGVKAGPFVQVRVGLVKHLCEFKGARLSVFMAIALHSNEDGWAWPSRARLARETGYSVDTVARAVADLCKVRVNGSRVLLRYQPQGVRGIFRSNRYLIFPTLRDLSLFEHDQPELIGLGSKDLEEVGEGENGKVKPRSGLPCTVKPCTVEPYTVKPCTENHYTNQNHEDNQKHIREQEPKQQADAAAAPSEKEEEAFCSIHQVGMGRRSKGDDVWYSHRLPDRSWCKGAPGDQPGDAVEGDPMRQGTESRKRYVEDWGVESVGAAEAVPA